jgi:hypothetical protein
MTRLDWTIIGLGSASTLGLSLWLGRQGTIRPWLILPPAGVDAPLMERLKAWKAQNAEAVKRWGTMDTRLHALNPQGYVDADPASLAREAGVPLDVYALASCMQSEEDSTAGRLAVGCAARNHFHQARQSAATVLLRRADKHTGKRLPGDGHFGRQKGRYAATSKPPTAMTLMLAANLLADPSPIEDATHGAVQWDAPKTQDRLHASDPASNKTSTEIAELRRKAGARMIKIENVPSTRFWAYGATS